MKILFFSYAFPNPTNPGLATFNRTMIAGLAKDHQVRVVSPVPFTDSWKVWAKGRLPRGLNDPAFQTVPNVPTEYCSWYYTPKCFRNCYGQFMHHSVRRVLNRTMRSFQPEIVLSYWTHPDGEVAVKTAHQFGIRAVAMVGGSDVLLNGRQGSRRTSILNVLQAADGVVTVSDDIKRVLIDDGISNKKLFVARRGIDPQLFHKGNQSVARRTLGLPEGVPILISVGRLHDVKGHVDLIDACHRLNQRGVSFRCYLLGDGPLRSKLQQSIEQLGLSHLVELKGSQSSAQLAHWYRAADLSVLASLSEGVPNVLLESIACGTSFVATNVGGIPEIADASLDCLVLPSNPAALADAIASRLAKSNQLAGRARCFEPPTIEQSAENLSAILKSVHTGRRLRTSGEAFLHETMTADDLEPVNDSPKPTGSSTCSQSAEATPADDAFATKVDVLGRTGEHFILSSPITATTQTATTLQNLP